MRNAKLFLSAAVAALITANTATAGQLYVANLSGAGETPATTSPFTGTAYFVLDNGQATGTYWGYHNIDGTLTGAEVRRGPAGTNGPSVKYTIPNATSPFGPYPTVILNPATDAVLLNNASIYIHFTTTAFPNGAIRGQFVPYTFAPQATNRVESMVATALDASAGYTLNLDNALVAIAHSSTAAQATAFEELSGRTLYAQSVEALDSLTTLQNTLFTHAAEANPADTFVAFAKAGYTFGKRDTTIDQAGAKVKRPYFMAGVDMRALDNVVAGIAVGYSDATDTFRGNFGKTNVTTTSGLAYVSANLDRVILQAVGQYGGTSFETMRNLNTISRTATSSHGGNGWSLGAKAIVPFRLEGDITGGPYVQIDTQHTTVHGYTEGGANDIGLVVPSFKDKDTSGEFGASLTAPLGPMFSARAEAGWHQSFETSGQFITTSFIGSGASFNTIMLGRSPSAGRVGLAVASDKSDIVYGEIGYQGFISGRMTSHAIELRLAIKM